MVGTRKVFYWKTIKKNIVTLRLIHFFTTDGDMKSFVLEMSRADISLEKKVPDTDHVTKSQKIGLCFPMDLSQHSLIADSRKD